MRTHDHAHSHFENDTAHNLLSMHTLHHFQNVHIRGYRINNTYVQLLYRVCYLEFYDLDYGFCFNGIKLDLKLSAYFRSCLGNTVSAL